MHLRRVLILLLGLAAIAWPAQLRQVAIIDIPGRPGFDEAVFANGMLVLSHQAGNTLDVFDPAKRRLVAQVEGLSSPHGMAVDAHGSKVYVANSGARNIAVVSSREWKLERAIPMQATPYNLVLSPDARRLWVANWEHRSISAVDLDAKSAVRTEDVGGSPQALIYDKARHVLLATLQDTAEVITLDPASLKVTTRYKLTASQPTAMVLQPSPRRLYVAVRHAVLTLDADDGREIGRTAAPAGVDSLWLDVASNSLYVASGGGFINVYRASGTLIPVEEIRTSIRGHTVAFDPARKFVFLPGGREGRSKLLVLKQLPPVAVPEEKTRQEVANK
jgi:DNA-binding beta-propeller fold protein YncE